MNDCDYEDICEFWGNYLLNKDQISLEQKIKEVDKKYEDEF